METATTTAIARFLNKLHGDTTVPDFDQLTEALAMLLESFQERHTITFTNSGGFTSNIIYHTYKDAAQVSRQVQTLVSSISSNPTPDSAIKFQILLDKVIVAFTSTKSCFKFDENLIAAVQALTRSLRPELLPLELYGYFLNRMATCLTENMKEKREESKVRRTRFWFAPAVLLLLPHLFNYCMRQQRFYIGTVEICRADTIRERVMAVFSMEAFWKPEWAAEVLDAIKLSDLNAKELEVVCNNVNQHILQPSISLESIPLIISNYLSLLLKNGVKSSWIMTGVVKLFRELEEQVEKDDLHETQTGTQSLRSVSTPQLRQTECLVFVTFDQFFCSHPKFALEFVQLALHAIAKGGLHLFSLGLLLVITKTNRQAKTAEKAMSALLQWVSSLQAKPNTNSSSASTCVGLFVPPVLAPARPSFILQQNERLVDSSKVNDGLAPVITHHALLSACVDGWDICVAGLVDLAFKIAELDFEPKPAVGKPSSKGAPKSGLVIKSTVFTKICIDMLCTLFERFEFVRPRILDELFLILLCKPDIAIVHVEILRKLILQNRTQMGQYMAKFNELVYQIGFLAPTTTKRLIRAFDPLMSLHQEFKDLIVMVLRKSSFSHDNMARSGAVSGFVQLLRGHVAGLTATQSLTPSLVEQMSLECLSFARRSFSQQPFIRATLYKDLASAYNEALVQRHHVKTYLLARERQYAAPELEEMEKRPKSSQSSRPVHFQPGTLETLETILMTIVDLISAQISTVITEEGQEIKFDISHCLRSRMAAGITNVVANPDATPTQIVPSKEILEPFHILLQSANCLIFGESLRENGLNAENAVSVPLYHTIDRFIKFILASELEQFELDKSSDFSLNTAEGLGNQEAGRMLLGIFETCIEYLVTVKPSSFCLDRTSKRGEEDQSKTLPETPSNGFHETEEESHQRHTDIYTLFNQLFKLRQLVKDGNRTSSSILKTGAVSVKKDDKSSETAENLNQIDLTADEKPSKSKQTEKVPKKVASTLPSLLTRRCVTDLLTLLCNPIKTSPVMRGPDNQKIVTPMMKVAQDFSVLQYVLHVALIHSKVLHTSTNMHESSKETIDAAIEGLVRNMDAPDFVERISGLLLYEASNTGNRIVPLGAAPPSVLALEIYVECLKYVTLATNMDLHQIARFATSSTSFLVSHEPARRVLEKNTSDEDKIAHFVDLIQSFVTPTVCFSRPNETEFYMTIISLISPLLSQQHLKSIALWIENLMTNSSDNGIDVQERIKDNLGLKLVPLMWSFLDRCEGNEVKSSYLMFARDIFMTCGGNGTSAQPHYAQEDAERLANHSLTFSLVSRSTVTDIATTLLENLETRIKLIEALYAEIQNAEKFVVVSSDGNPVESDSEEETNMDDMLTDSTMPKKEQDLTDDEKNDDEIDADGKPSHSIHLKRKAVIYKDFNELLEIMYCIASTQLSNAASLVFAKVVEKALKAIHAWLSAMLKRKDFEPIIPSFELFISSLGTFFGRLHCWSTGWLQGNLPFLPFDEKKRSRLVSQARTAASKHVPSLVYWMEKIHAEDLIKLAAKSDQESLLSNFKSNPHHDFAFQEGAFAEKMSKKRERPYGVEEEGPEMVPHGNSATAGVKKKAAPKRAKRAAT